MSCAEAVPVEVAEGGALAGEEARDVFVEMPRRGVAVGERLMLVEGGLGFGFGFGRKRRLTRCWRISEIAIEEEGLLVTGEEGGGGWRWKSGLTRKRQDADALGENKTSPKSKILGRATR
jgi:hypothetical protein